MDGALAGLMGLSLLCFVWYVLLSDVLKVTMQLKNMTEGMLVIVKNKKKTSFTAYLKEKNKNFLYIITVVCFIV